MHKLEGEGKSNMKLFQHSLHDTLPFEDNTFDVVLHNQVRSYFISQVTIYPFNFNLNRKNLDFSTFLAL